MRFVLASFVIWRLLLLLAAALSLGIVPLRMGFLGGGEENYLVNPLLWGWANMDGVHYLSIAQNGYFQFEQAFFPLYPLLIRLVAMLIDNDYLFAGLLISHLSFLASLIIFYKLLKEEFSSKLAKWGVILLLVFPTSFFYASVYTESLFLFFTLGSVYCASRKRWILAGILVALASATRLVGIFLLLIFVYEWWKEKEKSIFPLLATLIGSLGLLFYMLYLWRAFADPLMFFHVQPAFGAGRSGEAMILLPQVIYRYLRIFTTVGFSYDYVIAFFEFVALVFAIFVLLKNFRKIPIGYQIFAWLAILTPTLTGSLSSVPRYLLVVFPIFMMLGNLSWRGKILYLLICSLLLIMGTMFFFRGYFVA